MRTRYLSLAFAAIAALLAARDTVPQVPTAKAQFPQPPRLGTACTRISWDTGSTEGQAKMAKLYPRCKRLSQAAHLKGDDYDTMLLPEQPPQVGLYLPLNVLELRAFSGSRGVLWLNTHPLKIHAAGSDPDGDDLLYTFSATGGTLMRIGTDGDWDLSSLYPLSHETTATLAVIVDDGCGCTASSSAQVTLVP
jgi:hypothetical protein